ncbi:polycystic kidney disease 1-like 3 [Xanthomonas translucens]|uniref:polycystic kidney disease 1-like 3 n=1 Tax=Xanthomonas campestris pv. translucens TaxID=343 RepID=UPI001E35DF3D|nr:polycystic kidney disease 1-like 3 [Xanthomonas translucens]
MFKANEDLAYRLPGSLLRNEVATQRYAAGPDSGGLPWADGADACKHAPLAHAGDRSCRKDREALHWRARMKFPYPSRLFGKKPTAAAAPVASAAVTSSAAAAHDPASSSVVDGLPRRPQLLRQNATRSGRPAPVPTAASSWVSLPAQTHADLASLMSPPVTADLPPGTRGPLGALLRHAARKEALDAAVAGSPPSAAPSTSSAVPPSTSSSAAGTPPPVVTAGASATTAAPSAVKHIKLVKQPDATLQSLSSQQLGSLAQALNLAPVDAHALHDPAARAQLLADMRERLDMGLHSVFKRYDCLEENEIIKRSRLMSHPNIERSDRQRLQWLADHTHLWLRERTVTDPHTRSERTEVDIYFDGEADEARQQIGTTIKGGVGQVYRWAKEAGSLVAKALGEREDVSIRRVCGLSLGGGSAQMFAAGLQGARRLSHPPSLVLADPALFNRAQVKHALADSPHYDLRSSHGVIITLNAAHAPRRNLVDNLKTVRLHGTGLVRISLGLKPDDGRDGTPPQPSANRFYGYHANVHHYSKALNRFLSDATEPAAAHPASAGSVARVGDCSH